MTYKELKNQIKSEQKELAIKIRELKNKRKEDCDGYVDGLWHRKHEYRLTHIAYCEFFNKTPYEKIERPRKENALTHWNRKSIDSMKNEWVVKINEETLRYCA